MVQLNANGEVASFAEADQFPLGLTQFACGFYACYMAESMAPAGQQPTLSPQQIIDKSETAYAQFDGSNDGSNMDGMSVEQEYQLLQQIGLHYQALATDINAVMAWVRAGYPVIIAIAETSVFDMALGRNPYPWNPAGNHVILVTDVTSDGNVLVRDSANCTDLYNPNSLRPGPREYNAADLALVSATVVVPPWMPRPTSDTPPQGGPMIPQGWTDDGHTLTAPNGVGVELGFRDKVLSSNWNPGNWPQENEYHADPAQEHRPDLKDGQRICFRDCVMWFTSAQGVILEAYPGLELDACYKLIGSLQAEIAALKSAPAQSVTLNPDVIAQLAIASTALAAVTAAVSKAQSELPQ